MLTPAISNACAGAGGAPASSPVVEQAASATMAAADMANPVSVLICMMVPSCLRDDGDRALARFGGPISAKSGKKPKERKKGVGLSRYIKHMAL
jgi:hypothetical protein